MKTKIPLLDLWLVTGPRLRAGYVHRYEQGYRDGYEAGAQQAAEELDPPRDALGPENKRTEPPER